MSYEFTSDSEPVARKQHICSECGEPILKGERHFYQAGKFDGEFYQWRVHKDCLALCKKMHDDNGFDWYDGIQPLSEYDPPEVLAYRGFFPHAVCRYERRAERLSAAWEARSASRKAAP